MIEIVECSFGKLYDIKMKQYFTAYANNLREGDVPLIYSVLDKVEDKCRTVLQEELAKNGFFLDPYGDIKRREV